MPDGPSRTQPWIGLVEAALGDRAVSVRPLHGGCVSQVFAIGLASGATVAAKFDRERSGSLADEAAMLRYLESRSGLPVPRVLAMTDDDRTGCDLLITEFVVSGGTLTPSGEQHAAELLAALHDIGPDAPHERSFGFPRPTPIGGLRQPNEWADSWVEFFAERRLRPMAREAHRAGRIPAGLMNRVDDLCSRLDRWLTEPARPSLLHGDVWSGNVLVAPGGDAVAAFVDPALYFGHAEVELAFITLFGTFGAPFFERYSALRPVAPGLFEERRHLYNLYPLLVHARLFGGGYAESLAATLARFGA